MEFRTNTTRGPAASGDSFDLESRLHRVGDHTEGDLVVPLIDDRRGAVSRRIAQGSGASAANTGIFVAFQLLSVPLFLNRWGVQLYGEWLLIYTLPAYVSMIDIGFQSAVGSSMTVHVANDRMSEAASELRAYARLLIPIVIVASGIVVAGIDLIPIRNVLHIRRMNHGTLVSVGACLTVYGAANLLSGITSAGYKAVGLFSRQMTWIAGTRLFEYVVLLGLVVVSGNPRIAALGFVVARLIASVLLARDFRRTTPWLRRTNAKGDLSALRPLLVPTIGYFSFPLGTLLANQGMLVVASIAAPTQVVVLNTTRTVTNSFYQLFIFLAAGVTPEFSRYLGRGDMEKARSMQKMVAQLTTVTSLVLGGIILALGPIMLDSWTNGTVNPGRLAITLLLLSALTDCVWNACLPVLVGINRHQWVGLSFLISTLLSVPLSYALFPSLGIGAVGAALFTTSVFVTLTAIQQTAGVLEVRPSDIIHSFGVHPRDWRRLRAFIGKYTLERMSRVGRAKPR